MSWVDPSTCTASNSIVRHERSARQLSCGELASRAATQPVPKMPLLKPPNGFKLIGTPGKRLDTPAKVNGTAVFGIDVTVPEMLVAVVICPPVFGGKLVKYDASSAMGV